MGKGLLFDLRGHMLEEISADFRTTWTVNGTDPCAFAYRTNDAKNLEHNFEFGGWLVVLRDNGAPEWVGKFEPKRGSGEDVVSHTAISPIKVFDDRIGMEFPVLQLSDTAGAIFKRLIQVANLEEDTLLRPGEIYMGGKTCGLQVRPDQSLSKELGKLFKQSGQEVWFEPRITNNRLTILAHWKERLGGLLEYGLHPGNCQPDGEPLSEEGPIYNKILGIGSERQDKTRAYCWAEDKDSQIKFGTRAKPYPAQAEEQAAVDALTWAELRRLAWPRRIFKGTASNTDGTYAFLRLGNILPYDFPVGYAKNGIGTHTHVRLMGMTIDDAQNGAALVLQEYIV